MKKRKSQALAGTQIGRLRDETATELRDGSPHGLWGLDTGGPAASGKGSLYSVPAENRRTYEGSWDLWLSWDKGGQKLRTVFWSPLWKMGLKKVI